VPTVDGRCDSRFRLVAEVFVDVVAAGRAGSAVAIWHDGHKVVDLWGGRTAVSAGRWARDALVMPYSVSKPFSAVCALLLVERRLLAPDAPGRCYWPELAVMRPCAGSLMCGPCWPVPPPLIRTTPINVTACPPDRCRACLPASRP